MSTPDELCSHLEEFFLQVAACCEDEGIDAFLERELTTSQARTLLLISSRPAHTQIGDISRGICVSAAAAGRTVDQLLGMGLVARSECPSDRRVRVVTLTDEGRELLAAQLRAKREALREIVGELSDSTRSLLDQALRAALAERQPTTPG